MATSESDDRPSETGLLSMWRNTRMVVLTAISASLFAALLIPFKLLPLIPGVTELRPANAVPVLCSFLFGPAAAWGAAIGNLIGDFFGGFGPGAIFGAFGNFVYGLLPYRLWRAFSQSDPTPSSVGTSVALAAVMLVASAACALVIGWGLNALGFVPFAALANIILLNNFVVSLLLAPLLLRALYQRVRATGLCYDDLRVEAPRRFRKLGALVVTAATFGGLLAGNLVALGYVSLGGDAVAASQVTVVVAPFIVLLIFGIILL